MGSLLPEPNRLLLKFCMLSAHTCPFGCGYDCAEFLELFVANYESFRNSAIRFELVPASMLSTPQM
jgi:hypothetical protein